MTIRRSCNHDSRGEACSFCRAQLPWHKPRIIGPQHQRTFQVNGRDITLTEGFKTAETGYWLWPSSVALAQRVNELLDCKGLHVLELGPGLGLVGLTAAAKGAKVTFIDSSMGVCKRLADTIAANKLEGCEILCESFAAHKGTYDGVFGADVAYSAEIVPAIARLFDEAGPHCWLFDPSRSIDHITTGMACAGVCCQFELEAYLRTGDNSCSRVVGQGPKTHWVGPREERFSFGFFGKW